MPTKSKASKKEEPKASFGLKPVGTIRVFSKERDIKSIDKKKDDYTITDFWFNVSRKEDNGEYVNKSIKILFKKDAETPENNSTIVITDAFFTVHGEGEYARVALFIQNWDYLDE